MIGQHDDDNPVIRNSSGVSWSSWVLARQQKNREGGNTMKFMVTHTGTTANFKAAVS
jgi:hypothetical protein